MTRAGAITRLRTAWRPATEIGFAFLGVVLLFGRLELPLGISFGFNSFARNLAILMVVGALLRAPGLSIARSRIGPAFLVFLLAAGLSIAVNHGAYGDFRLLATACGIFYVARCLTDAPRGALGVFHWLGLFTVAVLLREVANNPAVLALRESYRLELVSDHANTLGFAFAMLTPIFLAGTARADRRLAAWLYAACSCLIVVISFSRSAWFALALGVVALALALGSRTRRRALDAIASVVLTTGVVALATGYLSLGRSEADSQRLRIIETSMSLFREHWPFGIGFGIHNLEQLFPVRYLELYGESLFLFHSHNFYVDILTGTGVVGAIAATYLVLTLVRVAYDGVARARDATCRLEAIAYAVSIGIFLVVGFVDMPLYHGRLVFLLVVVWALMESAGRAATRGAPAAAA
jgi:O-antigen ligase